MKKIKKYSKMMIDEIRSANEYIDISCKFKSTNSDLAEDFADIAKQELHHKDIIDKALKDYIEECEDDNGKSNELKIIYDFIIDINADTEAPVIAKLKMFE